MYGPYNHVFKICFINLVLLPKSVKMCVWRETTFYSIPDIIFTSNLTVSLCLNKYGNSNVISQSYTQKMKNYVLRITTKYDDDT